MTHTAPILSIITVVYNSETLIEYTIKSVLAQTYPNIEYVIIDGASTDKTLAIIDKYKANVNILVTEKDKGLYDAMNKGLHKATGDYVLFLNSGDELVSSTTVEELFANFSNADVYYGDTEIINEQRQAVGKRRLRAPNDLTWKSLKYGMNVSHQSFIPKRTLCGDYDTVHKINSDYDWAITVLKKAKTTQKSVNPIAKFLEGGTSRTNLAQGLRERFGFMVKHYGIVQTLVSHVYIAFRYVVDIYIKCKNIT
jgi:glycosyltransferase involved in cell wall biosynthesis